jgi:hypothetical protein
LTPSPAEIVEAAQSEDRVLIILGFADRPLRLANARQSSLAC